MNDTQYIRCLADKRSSNSKVNDCKRFKKIENKINEIETEPENKVKLINQYRSGPQLYKMNTEFITKPFRFNQNYFNNPVGYKKALIKKILDK